MRSLIPIFQAASLKGRRLFTEPKLLKRRRMPMKLIVLAPEDDNHTAPIKWAMEKAGQKVVCWAGLSWTDEGQSSLLIKNDDTMILGGHSVDPGDVIWVRSEGHTSEFQSG